MACREILTGTYNVIAMTSQNNLFSRPLLKRLHSYSATAVATSAAGLGSAHAAMVVTYVNEPIINGSLGIQFNLATGNFAAATASNGVGTQPDGSFRIADGNFFGGYVEITGPWNKDAGFANPSITGGTAASVYASLLGSNSPVGGGLLFGARSDFPNYGDYAFLAADFDNARGFVGLSFDIGGELHYGWAEVTGFAAPGGAVLHSFGYNDVAGEAATTIPETSSLLLIAAGAAGVGLRRKRQLAQA